MNWKRIFLFSILKMAANPVNQPLVEFLTQLSDLYLTKQPQDKQDPFRSRTFKEAAGKIKSSLIPITSGPQAKQLFTKIGASSIKEIDQFLQTGTSDRMRDLIGDQEQNLYKQQILTQLQTVHGIGPVKAQQLYDLGARNITDLQRYLNYLNPNSQIALKFYNDLQQRISRQYIDQIKNFVQQIMDYIQHAYNLSQAIEWQIAGSYRRGLPSSGDIDIIIKSIANISLPDITNILVQSGLIPTIQPIGQPAILAQGQHKTLAIAQLPDQPAVRLDLLYIKSDEYPFGLFYFTGSQYFNILMRKIALSKGWSLNEYRLTDSSTGQNITSYIDSNNNQIKPINSEEDIFRVLGVDYISPESRNYTPAEEEMVSKQLNLQNI